MELKIDNISKIFMNDGEKNQVLKDISFDIDEGKFVSLLGPSGCGKTTLLTIIAGFQDATSGQILVNGNKVTKPGPDRGFVFQNYALFPWMSVSDNIRFPMKQIKLAKEDREERLLDLLNVAKLSDKGDLYPHQLSGGMQQRTALVRALATTPEVLLMDEPLGALDYQMRQSLQVQLEEIWLKNRTTVVMVTHDVDEAVYLSDRVIVLSTDMGRIAEDLEIEMDRPRDRNNQRYKDYVRKLTESLS